MSSPSRLEKDKKDSIMKDEVIAWLFSIRNTCNKTVHDQNPIDVNLFYSNRWNSHDSFPFHRRLLIFPLTECIINKFDCCCSINHRRVFCFAADIDVESLTVQDISISIWWMIARGVLFWLLQVIWFFLTRLNAAVDFANLLHYFLAFICSLMSEIG